MKHTHQVFGTASDLFEKSILSSIHRINPRNDYVLLRTQSGSDSA